MHIKWAKENEPKRAHFRTLGYVISIHVPYKLLFFSLFLLQIAMFFITHKILRVWLAGFFFFSFFSWCCCHCVRLVHLSNAVCFGLIDQTKALFSISVFFRLLLPGSELHSNHQLLNQPISWLIWKPPERETCWYRFVFFPECVLYSTSMQND